MKWVPMHATSQRDAGLVFEGERWPDITCAIEALAASRGWPIQTIEIEIMTDQIDVFRRRPGRHRRLWLILIPEGA